ncbi:DUF2505 domain-containing protein [Actinomycetaceae bacterium TAE3-ERU4]|nr:DUF2505 domain-containing protein [Actinomycetaceae bacterium TAE3-ERU4]
MKVSLHYQYPAPIDATISMLSNPDFRKYRLPAALVNEVVASQEADGQTRVLTEIAINHETIGALIPASLEKFIPKDASLETIEVLHYEGNQEATCTFTVNVKKIPLKVAFLLTLNANGEQTEAKLEGEFTITVPFFGKTIENKASGYIKEIENREVSAATRYLKDHR